MNGLKKSIKTDAKLHLKLSKRIKFSFLISAIPVFGANISQSDLHATQSFSIKTTRKCKS